MKKYITTPIYYVNDKPHIGHAYTTLIADVFARYFRKKYGNENVFFLTGTDEHGSKVAKAAIDHNLSPQVYADLISNEYRIAWEQLNISYDEFFRTTDSRHAEIVQNFLQDLYNKGYIYKDKYKGLYCIGCEKFLSHNETNNGICVYHPNIILVEQEEDNYFFKLKEFSNTILDFIQNKKYLILPREKENEMVGKINNGVNNISISRPGVDWGIPLPWDSGHTVYVWVDALLNYYSATKIYLNKDTFWPPSLQIMAKDILWFHSVIWEGLLIANNLELPKVILAHGFFTIDGQKMSKSLGNVIIPQFLVNEYGCDGARYLILTSTTLNGDGDISLLKMKEKYNSDLANGLGNLIARITKLCEKMTTNSIFLNTVEKNDDLNIELLIEEYRPDEAIKKIWDYIRELDREISVDRPWDLLGKQLDKKLEIYIKKMLIIGLSLEPFLPMTSINIINIFNKKNITKPISFFLRK